VLLYGLRGDASRTETVRSLMIAGGTISVQVLNEMANVCRKKWFMDLSEVAPLLMQIRELITVVPVTLAVHERGLDLPGRYNFSVYDAMIVAAALEAGCDKLYSEDMQDGLVVDGRLTIRNPFRAL
jgi:predicted nucleic acid-binding protein